ncbi:IS1182-like element ISMac1 family transposase [Minisyncoccus archaeophilus]|uniref:IS1182 family transposase n=1 Tax=Minisyncoccus archaeiphilus TaxID=3238481 RepID=UPI00399CDFD1
MNFKDYQQKQSYLLPPNFGDFLGESHQAVILSEFIKELNTKELEQSYSNDKGGRSAYHPVMLLSIIIYGYMNSTFSSRQIAKQLKENLAFMYLSGNERPDFRTISRFRKEKGIYLEKLFTAIVEKAQDLGMISFDICSIDGTKIYANASKGKNTTKKDIKERISALIKEAEKIDELEDEIFGDDEDNENKDLKTKEGRQKKKEEIEKAKAEEENRLKLVSSLSPDEDTRINTTDPDSKLMKMKKKDYANGYNIQNITENGIIINSYISTDQNDLKTLIPSMNKMKELLRLPKKLLADKGYSSADNYSFCEENEIDAYIPAFQKPKDLSGYVYDKDNNTYTDKEGKVYRFKQNVVRKKDKKEISSGPRDQSSNVYRMIYENTDEAGKKHYISFSSEWQRHTKKQKEKLSTKQGKQIYKHRMHDAEGVFANIKKNLKFTTFNLRGLKGVNTEWLLISIAHNLKKMTHA